MAAHEILDDVTAAAAIAEARRRWGERGAISVSDRYRQARMLVGELHSGRFWVHGRGCSWPAAFADADARTVSGSRRKSVH